LQFVRQWPCAADAALPKASAAAPDSVAVGVFRRGARRWGSPRRKIPEAAVRLSAILEPEGDSERRPHSTRQMVDRVGFMDLSSILALDSVATFVG
jgi:hypothetical protein